MSLGLSSVLLVNGKRDSSNLCRGITINQDMPTEACTLGAQVVAALNHCTSNDDHKDWWWVDSFEFTWVLTKKKITNSRFGQCHSVGCSIVQYTRRLEFQILARTHAWVVGSVPSWGVYVRSLIDISLSQQCSLALSLPSSLFKCVCVCKNYKLNSINSQLISL